MGAGTATLGYPVRCVKIPSDFWDLSPLDALEAFPHREGKALAKTNDLSLICRAEMDSMATASTGLDSSLAPDPGPHAG
jgi:hypothetical protein